MLTTFEAIPQLDPEQPLRAISLPAWLQRCVSALTADFIMPTIPAELALNDEQQAAVAVRIEQLTKAAMACDIDHTMAVVIELLEGFAGARLSDQQAHMRAKAYITALDAIPTWAVAEAGRRWLQAKAGPQNYDFAPSPPRLREIANHVLEEVRAQEISLRRLLKAVPEAPMEYGNPRVTQGFKDLMKQLQKTNVVK